MEAMDENPYRAPEAPAETSFEPKVPGKRLPVRAWLIVAFFLIVGATFAVQGTLFLSRSANVLARYAGGEYPSLEYALTVAGLGIVELATSAFCVWGAMQFPQKARRAIEEHQKQVDRP